MSDPFRTIIFMNKVQLLYGVGAIPLTTPARHVLPIQSLTPACAVSEQRWASIQAYAAVYRPKSASVEQWSAWKPFVSACLFASLPRRRVSVASRQGALWRLIGILDATPETTVGEIFHDSSLSALLFQDMQSRTTRSTTAHVKRDITAMQRGMTKGPYQPAQGTKPSNDLEQVQLLRSLAFNAPAKYRRIAVQVLGWVESTNPTQAPPRKQVAQLRHWTRRKGFTPITLTGLSGFRHAKLATAEIPVVKLLSTSAVRNASLLTKLDVTYRPLYVLYPNDGPWIIPFPDNATGVTEGKGKHVNTTDITPQRVKSKQPKPLSLQQRLKGLSIAPKPLPDDLEMIMQNPSLEVISATQWLENQETIREIMRRAQIRGGASFRKKLRTVARFVVWASENDYDMGLKHLLTEETINNWVRHGLTKCTDETKSTYRSHLRRIAAHANPTATAPPKPARLRYSEIKPPYDINEIKIMRRVARNQPNPRLRGQIITCLALGLGAGLDSIDLKDLRINEITDYGERGIQITVPKPRPRTVWVLRGYEELLREGLELLPAKGPLVCPSRAQRKGSVGELFNTIKQAGNKSVHFEQSRLRATWLCALMHMPVPLAVLMRAAGLETARSINDLLPHTQDISIETAATILRGATQ